jgi:DNA-binding transcriptional ArsR family regulator
VSDRPQDHALAQRGLHPDVMELLPPGGKEKIGIDQVRDVIRMAQFSAVQAERKACLAPFAEDLTPEASNALLKILEEPTRGMVFALLAEHTGDLLPTIVSRSRVERVKPDSKAALAERLEAAGYAAADAAWLVRVAGRPGELDGLYAAHVDVGAARAQARARLAAASAADLVAASLDAGPIDRRESLLILAARAAELDPALLTSGVSALAAQERATLFVFLGELLSACAGEIRDSARGAGAASFERACSAIETANRALLAYSPPEAVLVSLFLAFGGLPRAQ